MTEFFDVGKHCSLQDCHQLDFLPLTCDACKLVFCKNHVSQGSHHCIAAHQKDKHVTLCPLCWNPVQLSSDLQLDEVIQAHIKQGCNNFKSLEQSIRCTFQQCKKIELVLMLCNECHHRFCLEHRFQESHHCQGFDSAATDIDLDEQLRNPQDFRNQCVDMMAKYFTNYIKKAICIPPLTSDERNESAGDLRNALASKIQGGILLSGLPVLQEIEDKQIQLPLPSAIRNQFRQLQRLLKLEADPNTQYITLIHPKIGFRIILGQSFVTKIEEINVEVFRKRMRTSFGNQKHKAYSENQCFLNRLIILMSRSLCSPQFSAQLEQIVQSTSKVEHSSYENTKAFCDYIEKEIETSSFDLSTDRSFHIFASALIGISSLRGFDSKHQASFLSPQGMGQIIFTPIRYQEGFLQHTAISSRIRRSKSFISHVRVETDQMNEDVVIISKDLFKSHSLDNIHHKNNLPDIRDYLYAEECATIAKKFYGVNWLPNIGERTIILPCLTAEEDTDGTAMQFVDYLLNAKLGGMLLTALPAMRNCIDMESRLRFFPDDALLALTFLQQLVHMAILQSQKYEQERALYNNYFVFFHPTLGVRVLYGRKLQRDIKMQTALRALLTCLCPSADNLKFKQAPIVAESARHLCDELKNEVKLSSNSSNYKQQATHQNLASIFLGLFTFTGYIPGINGRLFLTRGQWLALQSKSMLRIIYGPPKTGKSTIMKIMLLEQYKADEERDELERETQDNGNSTQMMTKLAQLFQAQYTRKHQRPMLCVREENLKEYTQFLEAVELTERIDVLPLGEDKTNLTDTIRNAGDRSLFIDAVTNLTFELKEAIRIRDYKTVVLLDCDLLLGLDQPKLYYLEWLMTATQPQNEKEIQEHAPDASSLSAAEETSSDSNVEGNVMEMSQSDRMKNQKDNQNAPGSNFIEQANKTINQFYPNWKEVLKSTEAETILIPACLDVTHDLYCGPLEADIPGYKMEGERKRMGQTAEDSFLRAFRELKIGGILINGFDTQFFLEIMMVSKVSGFRDKNLKKNWIGKHFECDFIFIHELFGLYLIEIKGSTTETMLTSKMQINKARDQIEKQRKILPELYEKVTKESYPFKIGAAISFPNANINKKMVDNFYGDLIDMKTMEGNFRQFWESKFTVTNEESLPTASFHQFIIALIGYRSLAFISEAYNAIQVHQLLEDREDKYFKNQIQRYKEKEDEQRNKAKKSKIATESNTENNDSQNKNVESAICLTNVQLAALECKDKCQLISGPPGTGKTLIILEKARQFAEREGKGRVIVCVYNPALVPKFEKYFANTNQVFRRKPLVIHMIPDYQNSEFREHDDWFCDEMPLQMNTSTLRIYKDRLKKQGTTVLAVTGFMKPKNLRMASEVVANELAGYTHFELNTTLRGSTSIIDNWRSELQDEVPIRIGHSIIGDKVERYKYTTVIEVLEALYDRLMPYYKHALINVDKDQALLPAAGELRPCHFAVLTEYDISAELVLSYLSSRGIPCGSPTDQSRDSNLVAVSAYLKSMSFEWPIVFIASVVCLNYFESLHLIGASRSMAKLIIIERDNMPVQRQIDELIDNCGKVTELEPAEFKHIVRIAREVMNENEPDSFLFDRRFAAVRHNYFPQSLRHLQLFNSCNDLSDLFTILAVHPYLCLVLLETDKVRQSVNQLASNFFTIGNRPTRVIAQLWSNLSKEEVDRRWGAFRLLANSLKDAYGKMKTIAANGTPDEVFARMFLKQSKDWDLVWEVLQVYLLTSVYSLSD